MEAWLQDNIDDYGTYQGLADVFNGVFGTQRTATSLCVFCSRKGISKSRKYCVPPTAKGKKLYVAIGSEREVKDGRGNLLTLVKTSDDYVGHYKNSSAGHKNWEPKSRVLYAQAHGEIPEGYCVIFVDGDRRNFDVDNLRAVSKSMLVRLNKYGWINKGELTKTGIAYYDLMDAVKGGGHEQTKSERHKV